jgi:hypothetical protein
LSAIAVLDRHTTIAGPRFPEWDVRIVARRHSGDRIAIDFRHAGAMSDVPGRAFSTAIVWAARIAWVLVAVFGGAAVAAAVDDRSTAVRWTATIGCWTIWAGVALALAIPSVRSLTTTRVAGPLAAAATIAAAIGGAPAVDLLALALPTFVAVAALLTPEFALTCVQASAYGDEHRFPLRAPAAAGAAAVIAWFAWGSAVTTGPLLLAARSWVAGGLVSVLAVAGLVFLLPRWHRLAQRWLVLVPAGLVVRDPVVLADTLMLRRNQITAIGLARSGTQAADLTGPASGYALEVSTAATVTAVLAFTPAEPNGTAIHLTAFLVSPSRPGRALAVAAERHLPVV